MQSNFKTALHIYMADIWQITVIKKKVVPL